jgi:hypothetical protein
MLVLAHKVLQYLGATEVVDITNSKEPSNEEEFLSLIFTSPNPITWHMYQLAYPVVEQLIGTKLLRKERNNQLLKTDWIMTVDNFQTLANKEEWLAYRQTLRDLPSNPPPFKWKNGDLDVEQMFPTQPKIIRSIQ